MIHQFKMNGLNIVLDVNSGAVHSVDNVAYDVLQCISSGLEKQEIISQLKYSKTEIETAISEIEELKNNELLFTESDYTDVLERTAKREPVVKALCLHIAHDCNLKCKYCFAKEGEYNSGGRSIMSIEVAKSAIDFVVSHSGNRRNIEIDLFGGEPLMNFGVVKELIEYSKTLNCNKKFRFTLTTNGMLLNDEIEKYILENMDNIVLSIDGRKEIHDYMRPKAATKTGNSSYDVIVPKFKSIADKRENYYVRGTFTHFNLDFMQDILHMAELGFKQISVEPVVSGPEHDYAIKEEDITTICNEYEKLAIHMTENKDFNFFHFNIDLTGGPCVAKRISGCGAGTEYLAVTPEGDLYPCHQFVNNKDFKMGDVFTGINKNEIREEFSKCNVYAKEECNSCFAKFYCSGGCAANAYEFHGDILKPYEIGCHLQRKRIECAIMLKVHEYTKIKI